MATRRSRLQVKPNIGPKGGPKSQGPAVKPSTSATVSNNVPKGENTEKPNNKVTKPLEDTGIRSTADLVSNNEATTKFSEIDQQTVLTATDDSFNKTTSHGDEPITDTINDISRNDKHSTETPMVIESDKLNSHSDNIVHEMVTTCDTSHITLSHGVSEEKSTIVIESSVKESASPKKPQLMRNRFTKIKPNIPVRSGSVQLKPTNNKESTSEYTKGESNLAISEKNEGHTTDVSTEKDITSNHSNSDVPVTSSQIVHSLPEKKQEVAQVTASPQKPLVIRNRLPKAKPNLTDLTRNRRPLPSSPAQGYPQSPLKSPMKSARQIFSPMKAVRDLSSLNRVPEIDESPSQEVNHVLPPTSSAVPSVVDKQPLAEQQIERRNRTLSMSESLPVKSKYKRPKVTASVSEPADRSKMKMSELIYWNPSRNPMKQKTQMPSTLTKFSVTETKGDNLDDEENLDKEMDENDSMPAPQVKIGPNGEIILNEASLVIENKKAIIENEDSVLDETDSFVTYASFREKRTRSSWGAKETEKFYKALSHIGTDFTLMNKVFPKRTRLELKQKFRKEDRKNRHLIEKALNDKKPFNQKVLDEMVLECNVTEKTKKEEAKRIKKEKYIENTEITAKKDDKAGKAKGKKRNTSYYEISDDEEQISSKTERSKSGRIVKRRFDSSFVEDFEDGTKYPVATWFKEPEDKEKERGEVVDILVNMSEGKLPKTSKSVSSLPKNSTSTATAASNNVPQFQNTLIQNLQLAGSNSDEGPFVLVYSQPDASAGPNAETVIHIYRLQGNMNGALTGTGSNIVLEGNNSNENSGIGTDATDSLVSVEFNSEIVSTSGGLDDSQTQVNHVEEQNLNLNSQENLSCTQTNLGSGGNVEQGEVPFIPFIPPPCQPREETASPIIDDKVEESYPLDEENVVYVSYPVTGGSNEFFPQTAQNLSSSSSSQTISGKAVHVELTNQGKILQQTVNETVAAYRPHTIPEENINHIEISNFNQTTGCEVGRASEQLDINKKTDDSDSCVKQTQTCEFDIAENSNYSTDVKSS